MAPGGFDFESSTAFVEPGAPLTSLVVFERDLFMAPDERGTSLRGRIGPDETGYMNNKTYGSGQVSQLPMPTPPDADEDEYESNRQSSRDGQRHCGWWKERMSWAYTLSIYITNES